MTKIAIITGASRGLGRNMARHLAAEGVGIIGTYHSNSEEADAALEEIRAAGGDGAMLQLDAADTASFGAFAHSVRAALKETFGQDDFDFLINNAGIGLITPVESATEDQFDTLVDLHFKGPFFLTQTLLPMMNDGGRILNVSSGLARFSTPGYALYAANKGAMEVLTRYQAKELGGRGIRVNVLAPGAIETDFGGGVVRDNADMNRMVADSTALGRTGQPDDIGGAVAAILSDGFGWANGVRIEVSGGMYL